MLEKLQKRIYRIVSAPPVLENLGSLPKCSQRKFFSIGFTLVDVYLNWFHFLIVEGALLVILIDCMIFLSSFLDVNKDVYVISFFPLTAKLCNSVERFALTFDLNGCRSKIKRYLISVGSI